MIKQKMMLALFLMSLWSIYSANQFFAYAAEEAPQPPAVAPPPAAPTETPVPAAAKVDAGKTPVVFTRELSDQLGSSKVAMDTV